MDELCPQNKTVTQIEGGTSVELGPHEFEILFKTMSTGPEGRSGSVLKRTAISQCKHCMKLKAEVLDTN